MRRNRKVFNNYLLNPTKTLNLAATTIPIPEESPGPVIAETRASGWLRPHLGWVKVNIDAAFSSTTGAGFGMVIRDNGGKLVVAAAFFAGHQLDSEVSEALCLKWAIQLSRNLQCTNVQFETDCMSILHSWNPSRNASSYFHDTVQESRILSNCFENFSLSHVKREANSAADFMSRIAYSHLDMVWFDTGPSGLQAVIDSDLCNSRSLVE